jgi:hypothetical protein
MSRMGLARIALAVYTIGGVARGFLHQIWDRTKILLHRELDRFVLRGGLGYHSGSHRFLRIISK